MSVQKLEKENEFYTVQVKIFKPFYEFIKAYLEFFADESWTVEDFIRQAAYDSVLNILDQFKSFQEDNVTHIPDEKWLIKWKVSVLFPDMQ